MKTPWGKLSDLSLDDHTLAEKIISVDKHQVAEGLVVECIFDQFVEKIQTNAGINVIPLDVETIIVDTNRDVDRWVVFVWARSKSAGLGRYLRCLEKAFTPYLLKYHPSSGFVARKIKDGGYNGLEIELSDLLKQLAGGYYKTYEVDPSVRDPLRQKHVFWGFLSNYYKEKLKEQIVLPRLLINFGIQPYFRSVWNLDRVFLVGDEIWVMEVKHKFPIELPPKENLPTLRFGVNEGELNVISKIVAAEIKCLHLILVKPFWSKQVGVTYLLNDLVSRGKTAIIAIDLNKATIDKMKLSRASKSGAHTTITGESDVKYRTIPANSFSYLGVLSDFPEKIALAIISTMAGEVLPQVSEKKLQALRIIE